MTDHDLEALKRVAQRMDDLFELPLADTPGLAFVGAKFYVELGDRTWRFSAGAADPDRQRAFRRCMGEAAETLAQFHSPRPPGQVAMGDAPTGLDAEEVSAMERLTGGDARSGGWVEASRLHDGGSSSVPAALCFRDLASGRAPPLSLGCAAGSTIEGATLSALFELVERDAVALWWRGGRSAGSLEHPEAAAFVEAARGGLTNRFTWFLDLTSDIGIPVAAAISSDRDGRAIALGFAARATVHDAMAAAFLELAQMELGNRLVAIKADRNGTASLAPAEASHHDRLMNLHADMAHLRGTDLKREHAEIAASAPAQRVHEMAALLARHGIFAHRVDLAAGDLAVPVVKVVAPLLQAEPAHLETERLARCRKSTGWAQSVVSHIAIL